MAGLVERPHIRDHCQHTSLTADETIWCNTKLYKKITNSKRKVIAMARGGQRSNAGRKAFRKQGIPVSLRIEKGVVDALKRVKGKRSLSLEIERRLQASLVDVSSKDRWGSPQNYALGRLIGELARFAADTDGTATWRNDRFLFEALRAAIKRTLDLLSEHVPAGPLTAPKSLGPLAASGPAGLGSFLGNGAWNTIKTAEPPPLDDLKYHDARYALPQIRNDLRIPRGKWTDGELMLLSRPLSEPT
jgi:hypothetical protein